MSLKKVMLTKIKEINRDKLITLARQIGERNNKSKDYVLRDMFRNFVKYGIGYTDYLKGDYINLTAKEKETYVTTKSFYQILSYLNNPKYTQMMNDKIIFNKIFRNYIGREWIDLRNTDIEGFKKFLKGKNHVFAKPPTDFGGHGIIKLNVSSIDNFEKTYNDLMKQELFLVEEEIKQHKELDKINPYSVVSFRIVTLVKNNKAYLLANALRFNLDEAVATGCSDAYFRLNEKGKVCSRVVDDVANVYEEHPLTHVKFEDLTIPYVKESFEMALKAALEVPEVRYVGWDIAITPNGPVLVEGNEYPSYGVVQYYLFNDEKTGHLKQIADILGDEMKEIDL